MSAGSPVVFLGDVEQRDTAERYVLVDDKLQILTAVKQMWGRHVITAFPRQGHYARDAKTLAIYPPADISLERIGDLLEHDLPSLRAAGAGSFMADCRTHRDVSGADIGEPNLDELAINTIRFPSVGASDRVGEQLP